MTTRNHPTREDTVFKSPRPEPTDHTYALRFEDSLWEALQQIPSRDRAEFVRRAIAIALRRKRIELPQHIKDWYEIK